MNSHIGSVFGENNHLIVIDKLPDSKMYKVHCNVCAVDSELFGGGHFLSTLGNLNQGQIPCGCSKSYRWSAEQYAVRVSRICDVKGYDFLGFNGSTVRNTTKIQLKCRRDGFVWESTTIAHLLSGNGCLECAKEIMSKSSKKKDDDMVKSFLASGKFTDSYKFWRSDSKNTTGFRTLWNYECPTCSFDEYVKAGTCSGLFSAGSSEIINGNKNCRCSVAYRWTAEQRVLQINNIIQKEKLQYKFVGWESDKRNSDSKIIMNCEKHGEWCVDISSFVNGGSRCRSCSKTGFRPYGPSVVYVLDVRSDVESFTGYGITGDIELRKRQHKWELKKHNLVINDMETFEMDGKLAKEIESAIKTNFEMFPQKVKGFRTEATYSWNYSNVVNFIEERLDKSQANSYDECLAILDSVKGADGN